ncbi:polysaccharide biosynthesis protein [Histidinibacterium lentulum]
MLSFLLRLVTSLSRGQKQMALLAIDVALVLPALALTLWLQDGSEGLARLAQGTSETLLLVAIMIGAATIYSQLLDMPRIQLKAFEQNAILRTAAYAAMVGLTGGLALPILQAGVPSTSTFVLFSMTLMVLTTAMKLTLKAFLIQIYLRGMRRQRVLIYGAGKTGVQLAAALKTDDTVLPVAFIDDNPTLQNMTVAGLPVHPPLRLEHMIREMQIDRVLLAMPSIGRPQQARLAARLKSYGCDVRTLPSFATLVGEGGLLDRIQPIDPDVYLNREGFDCDFDRIRDLYRGKSVMVTGAGGSIGSELCRQVLACRPSRLVLYEISEHALYQIERELRDLGFDTDLVVRLGSVTDEALVAQVMAEHEVRIVLHAAAYKHVPMVETNPLVGLSNNVLGTRILAEAAEAAGVELFILVSTDKAVRPTNVMGASKRLAELIIQDLANRTQGTRYSMVRFGNVLGSSGSVLPLFQEQISRGGPVTLTDPEVTRYFMTIGEASRLVLLAGHYAEGGDVFVLDMGKPVAIRDLARQMIEVAGYRVRDEATPDGDIEIVVTGLRPGEKLHEELLIGTASERTPHPKILRAHEAHLSQIEVATALRDLRASIEAGDPDAARQVLVRWVDGYAGGTAVTTAIPELPLPRDGAGRRLSGPASPGR